MAFPLGHNAAAAMKKRLNLERLDVATLSEVDRRRYEELAEFLRELEEGA